MTNIRLPLSLLIGVRTPDDTTRILPSGAPGAARHDSTRSPNATCGAGRAPSLSQTGSRKRTRCEEPKPPHAPAGTRNVRETAFLFAARTASRFVNEQVRCYHPLRDTPCPPPPARADPPRQGEPNGDPPDMKRTLSFLLRSALVVGCLAYIVHGVDFPAMWTAFSAPSRPGPWPPVILYQFVAYLPAGLRLSFLTGGDLRPRTGYAAFVLCIGLNNLLPAKLGELAKVAYMRRTGGIPLARGLSLVFLERFFDLNAALVLAMLASWIFGGLAGALPLAVLVAAVWCAVLIHRLRPSLARRDARPGCPRNGCATGHSNC